MHKEYDIQRDLRSILKEARFQESKISTFRNHMVLRCLFNSGDLSSMRFLRHPFTFQRVGILDLHEKIRNQSYFYAPSKNASASPPPLLSLPPPSSYAFFREEVGINWKLLTVRFREVSACKLLHIIGRVLRCPEHVSRAAAHSPACRCKRSPPQALWPSLKERTAASLHEAPNRDIWNL